MQLLNGARQPFVGIALASIAGILTADWFRNDSPAVLAALAIAACISLRWCNSLGVYALIAAAAFALHSANLTDTPGQQLSARLGSRSRPVTMIGVIDSEPKSSSAGWSTFLLKVKSIELEGAKENCNARVSVRWRGTAEFGDTVSLFGMAEPIAPTRNPGEFDMRAYLERRDVRTQLFVRYAEEGSVVERGSGNPIIAAAQKSRRWMESVLSRGLEDAPEAGGFINGMALGIRHETPEDIEQPFQQTGTLHLFAVAGLHVGIVARLLWIVATVLRVPRRPATVLIIAALCFYSAITGLHTSSVRAAVMTSVVLAAIFAEREAFSLNSLAVAAVLILGYDTQELFSTGFQLSFCVVGAIVLIERPIADRLRPLTEPDPFLPRNLLGPWRRSFHRAAWWIARATAVSLAAWLGSLIPVIAYFHLVTPVALFANLAVVPIAFFVLALAMLTLIAAPISTSLSLVFTNANWLLAHVIIGIVHLFAQLPIGHFYVEHPHRPSGARAQITVLDCGPGAAVHVRSRGADWMFDSGSAHEYERLLREYLHSRGVDRLDGLALSHGDSQHIGGASALVGDFRPRAIVESGAHDRSRVHNALIEQLQTMKFARTLVAAGSELRLAPPVRGEILFPPRGFTAKRADDQALVVALCIDERWRVLLMSDSGITTEQALLSMKLDLRSDIVVKGQHHSEASGSAEFIDAIQPTAIVATSRDFPQNERIDDDWAAMMKERGIKLFRQDQTGAVQLRFFRDHWDASAHITGEIFRSSSR